MKGRKEEEEEMGQIVTDSYLPVLKKGTGQAYFRNQKKKLEEQFPDPTAGLTKEEKKALKDQYKEDKKELSAKDRKDLEDTDNSVNQIYALMYMPHHPTKPSKGYQYGEPLLTLVQSQWVARL
jgi:hypothetical protein